MFTAKVLLKNKYKRATSFIQSILVKTAFCLCSVSRNWWGVLKLNFEKHKIVRSFLLCKVKSFTAIFDSYLFVELITVSTAIFCFRDASFESFFSPRSGRDILFARYLFSVWFDVHSPTSQGHWNSINWWHNIDFSCPIRIGLGSRTPKYGPSE